MSDSGERCLECGQVIGREEPVIAVMPEFLEGVSVTRMVVRENLARLAHAWHEPGGLKGWRKVGEFSTYEEAARQLGS